VRPHFQTLFLYERHGASGCLASSRREIPGDHHVDCNTPPSVSLPTARASSGRNASSGKSTSTCRFRSGRIGPVRFQPDFDLLIELRQCFLRNLQ
jgi:hypothetical protein